MAASEGCLNPMADGIAKARPALNMLARPTMLARPKTTMKMNMKMNLFLAIFQRAVPLASKFCFVGATTLKIA